MSIHSLNVWYFNGRSQRLLLGKLDQKLENSKLTNYSGGKIQLNQHDLQHVDHFTKREFCALFSSFSSFSPSCYNNSHREFAIHIDLQTILIEKIFVRKLKMGGQLHFLVERVSSFERERIVENSGKVNPRSRLLIANNSSQITYRCDFTGYQPSK